MGNSKTSKNNNQEETLLVHGIAEEKKEITDEMIANTLNEKLDLDITLRDIEWMHRIGEHNQLEEKPGLLL